MTDSPERLALTYLAAVAATFPHVNHDGEGNVGVPDDHPNAVCLGCTVGQTAQILGVDMCGDDEGNVDAARIVAALATWRQFVAGARDVAQRVVKPTQEEA